MSLNILQTNNNKIKRLCHTACQYTDLKLTRNLWGGLFCIYRVSQNYVNTNGLFLSRTVVSSIPHKMCVRALNRTVARWSLCVKQDGEQVETVQ